MRHRWPGLRHQLGFRGFSGVSYGSSARRVSGFAPVRPGARGRRLAGLRSGPPVTPRLRSGSPPSATRSRIVGIGLIDERFAGNNLPGERIWLFEVTQRHGSHHRVGRSDRGAGGSRHFCRDRLHRRRSGRGGTARAELLDAGPRGRDGGHLHRSVPALQGACRHRVVNPRGGTAGVRSPRGGDGSGRRRLHRVRRAERADGLVRAGDGKDPRTARGRAARRSARTVRHRALRRYGRSFRRRVLHLCRLSSRAAAAAPLRDHPRARRRCRGGCRTGFAATGRDPVRPGRTGLHGPRVLVTGDRQRRSAAVRRHDGFAESAGRRGPAR
jgi:hypothetical protein